MSGSGSTVFALSEDKTRIEKALRHYAHTDMFVCDTTLSITMREYRMVLYQIQD